jgi:hypothetical protein
MGLLPLACHHQLAVGEVAIRGSISNVNGAIMMSVVPKANNSKDITRMTQTLTQWADEGAIGRIGFQVLGADVADGRQALPRPRSPPGRFRGARLAVRLPGVPEPAASTTRGPAQSILPPIEFRRLGRPERSLARPPARRGARG